MTTQEIVAKLWNLCNVLRDDGITYHQYVTELTYILFLKMAKETDTEAAIPEDCRWEALRGLRGLDLKNHYKKVLDKLGTETQGRVREIYAGAATSQRTSRRSSRASTSSTGSPRRKRASAASTRDCSRRTPTRKNPAQASTSRRACSSTS